MIFADPHWLRWLLVLPVIAGLEWLAIRRARIALERLVGARPDHALLAQHRAGERQVGALLRLAALGLLILGAARPEWGREVVRRGATGSDVVLAIDVSASMDARDVAPSRLAEARREALGVLDRLGGSRVGVVAFAGDAVRMCPLTLDRAAARLTLEGMSSTSINRPGTDLGRGVRMALRVLPQARREEQAIVLWTDGEDLEAGAKEAIDDAARTGVRVFTVGVGTPSGDVIPVIDPDGDVTDVKRDDSGNPVRSRLDETPLRTLARRTRGAYFAASRPGGELPRLISALGGVSRAGRGDRLVERSVARFPLFAFAAALLITIERVRPRRRKLVRDQQTPSHSERGAAAAAVLLVLLLMPSTAGAQSPWARGNRAFKQGHFAVAESLYSLRLKKGDPAAVRVNRATARALAGKTEDAAKELEPIAGRDDRSGHEAGYNLGTLLGQKKEYSAALQSLRRVLERNPRDADARWNYELLARRQEDQKRKQSQPPPQPQPQQPQPSGGGGGNQNPQPNPGPQNQPQQSPSNPGDQPQPGSSQSMSRAQADQLLGALQELARLDQQRHRKVGAVQEKRGRDW